MIWEALEFRRGGRGDTQVREMGTARCRGYREQEGGSIPPSHPCKGREHPTWKLMSVGVNALGEVSLIHVNSLPQGGES